MGVNKASSLTRVKDKKSVTLGISGNKFAIIRKAKTVNQLYERVSNPVCFAEITQAHFNVISNIPNIPNIPNIIPSKLMINMALSQMFGPMSFIHELYDKLSTSKDLCESTVHIIKKKAFRRDCIKSNALYAVKIYIILYKVIWMILEMNGVPKDHNTITAVLDYVNLFMSNF